MVYKPMLGVNIKKSAIPTMGFAYATLKAQKYFAPISPVMKPGKCLTISSILVVFLSSCSQLTWIIHEEKKQGVKKHKQRNDEVKGGKE
ncbi:MAG: hypothetical protein WBG70_14230 [Spirulinaceae cyanobacterium]